MSVLLFIALSISLSFAGLDRILIQNLDLEYALPHGTGVVEKLVIGVSIHADKKKSYPVEIFRTDSTFDVTSESVDFQWLNPITYFHNLQQAQAEKLNLKIGHGEHIAQAKSLVVKSGEGQLISMSDIEATCTGDSTLEDVIERLKSDCLKKMKASLGRLEISSDFINTVGTLLPELQEEAEADRPVDDFRLSINEGELYSHFKIKYVIRAHLKLWGKVQLEESGKVLAINVNLIKFGILPVTDIVMNELRRQVHNPKISVNPPWIRIQLGN